MTSAVDVFACVAFSLFALAELLILPAWQQLWWFRTVWLLATPLGLVVLRRRDRMVENALEEERRVEHQRQLELEEQAAAAAAAAATAAAAAAATAKRPPPPPQENGGTMMSTGSPPLELARGEGSTAADSSASSMRRGGGGSSKSTSSAFSFRKTRRAMMTPLRNLSFRRRRTGSASNASSPSAEGEQQQQQQQQNFPPSVASDHSPAQQNPPVSPTPPNSPELFNVASPGVFRPGNQAQGLGSGAPTPAYTAVQATKTDIFDSPSPPTTTSLAPPPLSPAMMLSSAAGAAPGTTAPPLSPQHLGAPSHTGEGGRKKSLSSFGFGPEAPRPGETFTYVNQDTWGYLGYLTDSQQAALGELRAKSLTCKDAKYVIDDECLLRFLRARKFDVRKAEKMFREHLAWRDKYMPSTLTPNDISSVLGAGVARFGPYTKSGLPITMIKVEFFEPSAFDDLDLFSRYVAFFFERALQRLPRGADKGVLFFDMHGWTLRKHATRHALRLTAELVNIVQAHNPERLDKCVLFNTPWIFSGTWSIIRGWLDPVVEKKVVFVKDVSIMLEMVDAEHLPEEYGGVRKLPYPIEGYMELHAESF